MTFAELCAEVYLLTKRADLVAVTESAVKSATLVAHQIDYFWKDLQEVGIAFDSAEYIQQLDYRTILPRFRSIKYLRKYDFVNTTPGAVLNSITPEEVFDAYGVTRQDVFYSAGAYIQINSSTEEQYYLCGYYINPGITATAYASWIADDHPYVIIYKAAASVCNSIGNREEATGFTAMWQEQRTLLTAANLCNVGY